MKYYIFFVILLSFACDEKKQFDGFDLGGDVLQVEDLPINEAPIAVDDIAPATKTKQSITIDVLSNDSDDNEIDTQSLRIRSEPESVLVQVVDGKVEFRSESYGTFSIQYDVADDQGERSNIATLSVEVVNSPPIFESQATLSAVHDEEYRYLVQFSDPDAEDELTLSGVTLPDWLTLDENSEETLLSGKPNAVDVGQLNEVVLRVSDGELTSEQKFSIQVEASTADQKLEALNLNRDAAVLTDAQLASFPKSKAGFRWNAGDDETEKWRPQGIAEINTPTKTFVAVSWYGRDNYADRGVRISFADVSDFDEVKYRHVILVDSELNPLSGVHAGGIVHKEGKLYVPDSRSAHRIHVFPLDSITKVEPEDLEDFYGYGYYLQTKDSFTTEVKPSFMSYDWTRDEFLFGSFTLAGAGPGTLQWSTGESKVSKQFYEIMQGAASAGNRLWIAASYGRSNNSTLYYSNYVVGDDADLTQFSSDVFPPGLEDFDLSSTADRLWMLTEFGPHEGPSTNHRSVFFADPDSYFP